MPQNEDRKGVGPQIIAAVVVALLVGGSTPWWWDKVFGEKSGPNPPPKNQNYEVGPPREPPQGGQIRVECSSSPHSIPAGGNAEIRVLALTEDGTPLSAANVRLDAGGGWFSSSGTGTEVGQTDDRGSFRTQWRSPKPAARSFGLGVTVTKNGFKEGRAECNVSIE